MDVDRLVPPVVRALANEYEYEHTDLAYDYTENILGRFDFVNNWLASAPKEHLIKVSMWLNKIGLDPNTYAQKIVDYLNVKATKGESWLR
jgi:hypothetical protein